jgi:hypothetical protein
MHNAGCFISLRLGQVLADLAIKYQFSVTNRFVRTCKRSRLHAQQEHKRQSALLIDCVAFL